MLKLKGNKKVRTGTKKSLRVFRISRFLCSIYSNLQSSFCFDVAQGRMNGAPNETRTHSCRFASLACDERPMYISHIRVYGYGTIEVNDRVFIFFFTRKIPPSHKLLPMNEVKLFSRFIAFFTNRIFFLLCVCLL